MQSPLPDSTALEAGIIEDPRPSRLSRVQDNVRNLLRSSVVGSIISSPRSPVSPVHTSRFTLPWPSTQPEVLPSPTNSIASTTSTASTESVASTAALLSPQPTTSYQQAVKHISRLSSLIYTREVTKIDHPDIENNVLAEEFQDAIRHRQHRAWKRSKRRETHARIARSRVFVCTAIALTFAGLLSTYIGLAITNPLAPPVFHILFIMGILLVLIVFIHTIARLLFVPEPARHKKHAKPRHRAHHGATTRTRTLSNVGVQFAPTEALPVVMQDDVPLDPHEAMPSNAVPQTPVAWNRQQEESVVNPPPAYGRWRGSVKVNPDLLHWQPVTAQGQVSPQAPSPTYEESQQAQSSAGSPPSYKTRDSPSRDQQHERPRMEMIEGRGIGNDAM